jgi:hypothetical protein
LARIYREYFGANQTRMRLGDQEDSSEYQDIDIDGDLDFDGISCHSDSEFDRNVGLLEDIIIEDDFTLLLDSMAHKYCEHFDDNEVNKLEYTMYFNEYTHNLEKYIQERLKKNIPEFDLTTFLKSLENRKEELKCSDVFDLLTTLTDFSEFKSVMLSYKENGKVSGIHADDFLTVTSQRGN